VRHVGDVHPEPVPSGRALDGDGVVEIPGVCSVYRNGGEVAEVLAVAWLPGCYLLGLFLDLPREAAGSADGSEERLVDVARVL
jgi:hypothetical protein